MKTNFSIGFVKMQFSFSFFLFSSSCWFWLLLRLPHQKPSGTDTSQEDIGNLMAAPMNPETEIGMIKQQDNYSFFIIHRLHLKKSKVKKKIT